jgi:hypothetical protein
MAKHNKAVCAQIFSYAILAGAATRNPVLDMRDVLQVVSRGNFPAIASIKASPAAMPPDLGMAVIGRTVTSPFR